MGAQAAANQTLLAWGNQPPWILATTLAPLLGLAVFVLRSPRARWQAPSERVREAGTSVFLGALVMEYAYWALNPAAEWCVRRRITPTMVTLAGLATVTVGCVMVALGNFGLGGPLILAGSLSDMLDGAVARRLGVCSPSGQFIDAMADRYADVALLFGLAIYYCGRAACLGLVLATLLSCVTVSYARAKAEALGVQDVPRAAMRRAERTVYLGFAIHLAPLVARLSEPRAARPRYDLVLAACAMVAGVCHVSTARMIRYTIDRLRRS